MQFSVLSPRAIKQERQLAITIKDTLNLRITAPQWTFLSFTVEPWMTIGSKNKHQVHTSKIMSTLKIMDKMAGSQCILYSEVIYSNHCES